MAPQAVEIAQNGLWRMRGRKGESICEWRSPIDSQGNNKAAD
jgi:hypothetical protein